MKILGIDYGTVRMGVAVSDESLMLARELAILSPKELFETIQSMVTEHEVSEIVVGLPITMSGHDSEKTKEVRAFADRLRQQLSIPIRLLDERLSSSMAETVLGKKNDLDSMAAQIILQNYLNSLKKAY